MKITPIRNEKDYQNALNRLEEIFDAKKELNKEMNWKSFQS